MSAYDLILIVFVAAGAFYAGYQVGRLKALAERDGASRPAEEASPLPGPRLDPAAAEPPLRHTPPPASAGAGDGLDTSEGPPRWRTPPRRSSRPPPAAAGLLGAGEKPGKGQK